MIGKSIGRYHIVEQLGQGGMATVYKAFDTRLERHVAIKFIRREKIPPELAGQMLARFEREARALAKLKHPHIVQVYDYGEHDGTPYLVMEYLPSGTLKQKMSGAMSYLTAANLLTPIAEALACAHQQQIIHRDIKPSNILLTEKDQPMLTDFGVAKVLDAANELGTLTGTGVGVGTPEYMAPEQWSGEVDYRTDVYALGVVFYEMVTGKRPYVAETPAAILIKQIQDPLPRPKDYVPDLPDRVEEILFKALAKKRDDRYQTMAEFAEALAGLREGGLVPEPHTLSKRQVDTGVPTRKVVAAPTVAAPALPVSQPKSQSKFELPLWVWGVSGLLVLGLVGVMLWNSFGFTPKLVMTTVPTSAAAQSTAVLAAGKIAVGIVLPTRDVPRWAQDETRFQDALKATGYDVEILFSQGDSAKEKANVESLITKGVKVLIICPQDGNAAAASADAARKAGVKVISYDRLIRGTDAVDYYVTFDSVAVGFAQSQYLIDKAGNTKGNNLYLYAGAASDNNAFIFFQGAWETIQPKIADGTFVIKNSSEAVALQAKKTLTRDEQAKIIGQITTNWDFNTAKSLAEANLTKAQATDKGTVYIVAPNDSTGRAIADAFAADKAVTKYYVTGQDAEKASVQYIIDGKQSMTVLKDLRTLVKNAITASVALLKGDKPASNGSYNNGWIDVPTIQSAVITVTVDNVKAALIDSGYYQVTDFNNLK